MDAVRLAGRRVRRLGISVAGLRTTGMWGEPAGRRAAVEAIRRAAELGAEVMEVPVPFGPYADLFRDAETDLLRDAESDRVFLIARLTGGPGDLDAAVRRLGRRPDLLLAGERRLGALSDWPGPVGAIVASPAPPVTLGSLAAVRGPHPPAAEMLAWCEGHGIPYLAPSTGILAAGELTIALPAPRSRLEVERLLGDRPAGPLTPPAAEPG